MKLLQFFLPVWVEYLCLADDLPEGLISLVSSVYILFTSGYCSKCIPFLLIFNNGREEPFEIIIYQHFPKIKYYILYHIVEFLLNCCFSILPDHLPCLSPAVPSTWHRAMALPEPALPDPALLPDHLPRPPPAAAVLPRSAVPLGCCAVLPRRRAGARAGLRIF